MNKATIFTGFIAFILLFPGCTSFSKEERMEICGESRSAIFSIGFSIRDTEKANAALVKKFDSIGKEYGIDAEEIADICEINL